jgi:predicted nucleic acid-binding protein
MKQKICIDTGVITQYLSSSPPEPIINTINRVIKGEIECHILKSVLIEVYYQICKWKGIEFARNALTSFQKAVPYVPINLDDNLIQSAGMLKCQHRTSLSYIDCMSISYCLNNDMEFHTTEKTLKGIKHNTLDKLKVKKYRY